MPLDVVRLIDSNFAVIADGEPFKAAVLLWCKAWHQVPCASLPDDDRILANMAGLGRDVKAWKKLRDVALHGFVKCSDGRLYHPVIAEKAVEAWESKVSQRSRTEAATRARMAKNKDRHEQRDEKSDDQRDENVDEKRDDTRNVHQGTGTGTGTGISNPLMPPAEDLQAAVNLWNAELQPYGISMVQGLSPARQKSLTARLHELGGLDGWSTMIGKIRSSPYLLGQSKSGWRVFFDWVLKPANITKIMEGNYDDNGPGTSGHGTSRSALDLIAEAAREQSGRS